MPQLSLYETLTAAKIPTDHHESDLQFLSTDRSLAILAEFPLEHGQAIRFRSQIDKQLWVEVPFAYTPFWDNREKRYESVRLTNSGS